MATLFELKQLGENKLAEHNEIMSNPKQEAEDLLLYPTKFTKAELFLKQKEEATEIDCPMLADSPVNIECRVTESKDLGSHTMFLAEVLAVHADERYMDKKGRFDLRLAKPIVYSHGDYMTLGKKIGSFGWSVKKR